MSIELRKYLAETERHYNYRIKTVVPIDDSVLDRIDRCIAKYLPVSVGRVQKTMFQRNPLDFAGVENAEVYYIDIQTSLPASPYVLQQDIRMSLGIPEKFIIVRGENDPSEVETQRINAVADMDAEAKAKGLTPAALLNNPEYPEGAEVDPTEFYGDDYNTSLKAYLKKIADERKMIEIETVNAPFKWLLGDEQEPIQDKSDYNENIPGAPGIAKSGKNSKGPQDKSDQGNMENNTTEYKRVFTDKNGKTTVLKKTGVAVKKDK